MADRLRAIYIGDGWLSQRMSHLFYGIGDPAWKCLIGAVVSLGVPEFFIRETPHDADVFSEAIEAAEALGL